jgi:hypothetical protein
MGGEVLLHPLPDRPATVAAVLPHPLPDPPAMGGEVLLHPLPDRPAMAGEALHRPPRCGERKTPIFAKQGRGL